MPLFTLLNVLIIWGLNFLVYEQLVDGKKIERRQLQFLPFFLSCLIITTLFTLLIVYGYTSAFVAL